MKMLMVGAQRLLWSPEGCMVIGGGLGPRDARRKSIRVPKGRMNVSMCMIDHGTRLLSRRGQTVCKCDAFMRPSGTRVQIERRCTGAIGPRLRSWGPPGPEAAA